MKIPLILLLFVLFQGLSAQSYTLSGYIKDVTTGEILPHANLYDSLSLQVTTSNEYGYYSISFTSDTILLKATYIGYKAFSQKIPLSKNQKYNIELQPVANLPEVLLKAEKNQAVTKTAHIIHLPMKTLKAIPMLGGEVDVVKALTLTPGVNTGTEGTANIMVRGGSPDQTLILLDGAAVYNATHLGGFLSTFDPSAIQNIQLYKAGFPARYGGRLSSILDIQMKEGNKKRMEGEMGLGLVASKIRLEGPLINNKNSFFLSARSSYLGLVTRLFQDKTFEKGQTGNRIDLSLYDINAKINFQIDSLSHLFVSCYTGRDKGLIQEASSESSNLSRSIELNEVEWGNLTSSLRYTRILSPKLFLKTNLLYTQYHYQYQGNTKHFSQLTEDLFSKQNTTSSSQIKDLGASINLDYALSLKHQIKFGIQGTQHFLNSEQMFLLQQDNNQVDTSGFSLKNNNLEIAAYVEDRISIKDNLSAELGLRWSHLLLKNKTYAGLEPRLGLSLEVLPSFNLRASYTRMRQYLHLLNSSGIGFPNDIWVTSTSNIAPQKAWQASLGSFGTFFNEKFTFEIDAYYKQMNDLITQTFSEGSLYSFEQEWEQTVETQGKGTAYGLEFFLQKPQGKMTGFLAYTWSFSNRQFEHINQNKAYPFSYDRRHDFAISLQYSVSKNWQLAANWVYQTGRAVTLPVAISNDFLIFKSKNNGRLLDYHRLDLASTHSWQSRRGRNCQLIFSIYNVYNRHNPFYVSVQYKNITEIDETSGESRVRTIPEIKQTNLFPIIPSVSFHYKFANEK